MTAKELIPPHVAMQLAELSTRPLDMCEEKTLLAVKRKLHEDAPRHLLRAISARGRVLIPCPLCSS
jgi:hypothetical protein